MKLATYKLNSPLGLIKRAAIFDKDTLIDLQNIWKAYFLLNDYYNYEQKALHSCPSSLSFLIKIKEDPLSFFRRSHEIYQKVKDRVDPVHIALTVSDYLLCNPLDDITSYRDFYAHEQHVKSGFAKKNEEVPKEWYEFPAYYKGSTTSFIGPDETIAWPSYSDKLDFELEMGMVVGRDGKNISSKKAHEHILGFTILNDISARDTWAKERVLRMGPAKAKDFCSVLGPVIVTIDEFQNREPDLTMTAKINGDQWSKGQSGDYRYSFSQMIEHVSKDEWLRAGDLFGSGTVGTGCGLELDKWIKPGDEIELEIEKIGVLSNTVGEKENER